MQENQRLKAVLERERQERQSLIEDLQTQLGVERSKVEQQQQSISQM